ncbi:MAG: D-arabitol-phosphate dehydrogenase [Firmicutes bacterium ADurb.Bin506]|jgi:L-iditol 2-dehydrogenase|nr:MAG: D-arabitol-phosphate dehydrogenase [Firmicutes bacterium ADurb.Bin506]
MKGLFKTAPGPGNMEIRETPKPSPGPGQVMVKVEYTGICGSDLHIFHSDIAIPVRPPVITGHEFSGTIAELGEGVTGWKVGDRVTSETAVIRCDVCEFCRSGFYNVCPERRTLGYWVSGAFANYVVVPARNLHALPDSVSFLIGAMTEPTACCVHAVNELTDIRGGDVVAIIGPGSIGLICAQLARVEGAEVVVLGTSRDAERLKAAEKCGVRATIDVNAQDPVKELAALTRGRGPDVVIECSGAAAGTRLGLELVRRRGQFTQVGLFGKQIELDFERICYKELKVTGSIGSIWSAWNKALHFMERGLIDLSFLATDILPLTEWQEGFRRFEAKEGLKIFLRPVAEDGDGDADGDGAGAGV